MFLLTLWFCSEAQHSINEVPQNIYQLIVELGLQICPSELRI